MFLRIAILALIFLVPAAGAADLGGAWQRVASDGTISTWIVSGEHFSIAHYRRDPAKFVATEGGTWAREGENLRLAFEFHTAAPERVGSEMTLPLRVGDGEMTAGGEIWRRIDDATPGALEGAWLMTGRKRDGEISTRTPGARRTMKILSGTRFQWIAYNVDTREYFGTGGGTYSTVDGDYTESIEFFSRDDAKAGLVLPFRYSFVDGVWHHDGKSTAGEPMYEVWNRRDALGI